MDAFDVLAHFGELVAEHEKRFAWVTEAMRLVGADPRDLELRRTYARAYRWVEVAKATFVVVRLDATVGRYVVGGDVERVLPLGYSAHLGIEGSLRRSGWQPTAVLSSSIASPTRILRRGREHLVSNQKVLIPCRDARAALGVAQGVRAYRELSRGVR